MAIALGLRRARSADDEGSIAMALMLIMVGISLATLLVPLIITQTNNTKTDYRRQHALDAAQAGLDYMVGQIRGASDTMQANGSNGARNKLPCTLSGTTVVPQTGVVTTSGNQRYRASVYYFARDPHGHPEWITDSTKWIKCSSGSGPSVVPAFAVVVSTGSDDPDGSFAGGTRTVQATYAVKSLNQNVPGGALHVNSAPKLCLDAGSTRPVSGTVVTTQPCSSGIGSQTWTFDKNYRMLLTDSDDPASNDLGMCMTAAFTHVKGQSIVMRPCTDTTSPEQQFSYRGFANMTATEPGTKVTAQWCWAIGALTSDQNLKLDTCVPGDDPNDYDPLKGFYGEAAVGPGGPLGTTSSPYLVNYKQFGRCITFSHYSVDPADQYYSKALFSYPCSASADPTAQAMNQEYYYPVPPVGVSSATGQIKSYITRTVNGKTVDYCLISPMTLDGQPYPDKCSAAPSTASKTWTVWRDTGAYGTSYRITDSSRPDPLSDLGYCIQPSDLDGPNPKSAGGDVSIIVLATCSSSTMQKWNAPPGIVASPVTDYQELYGPNN